MAGTCKGRLQAAAQGTKGLRNSLKRAESVPGLRGGCSAPPWDCYPKKRIRLPGVQNAMSWHGPGCSLPASPAARRFALRGQRPCRVEAGATRPAVMVSAGIELIFFTLAGIVLCFEISMEKNLLR